MERTDDLTLPVRRWPLWLGIALVILSTGIIVSVFALSVSSSERAATDRVLAAQTISRLRSAQTDMNRAAELIATTIVRQDSAMLPLAAVHARSATHVLQGEGGDMKRASGEWMRRFYAASAAGYSGDWPGAHEALTRLVAEQGLATQLAQTVALEGRKWESADEGMMVSDARSRGFVRPVAVAGALLVVAAGLLGWLAAQAMRLYRRARRHSGQEEKRADALEDAVRSRTTDLVEANAHLEREMIERGAAEAQLRHGQKMEAIGQLTGGIAHDFNNMLAVVVGGIELARRGVEDPAQVSRHLDRAMEGCERAVALTRRLLSFARAEPANAQFLSLNMVVTGLSDMLERTLGEHIAVQWELSCDLWPVLVDRGPLENAILNLAVNARDAMPEGGSLVIATRNDDAGERVELAVTDSGIGMEADVRDRALEPFFTTKPSGQGTGLGLSQIFGLVNAAHGTMVIDSAPGEGTTIRITLPAYPDSVTEDVDGEDVFAPHGPAAPRSILVVEDDSRVRRSTVSALEALGHRVRACSDGAAALALLRSGSDVELLVSDVVMPGLSGPDLVEALERGGRALPILFVTGYADTRQAEVLARHEVLRKPFTIDQLNLALARALDRFSAPCQTGSATEAATAPPVAAIGAATT